MAKMRTIKAGELVMMSAGEYSDYGIHGLFRAKADIDPDTLVAEWLAAHPEQNETYRFREHQFLAEVCKRGLLEDVAAVEWHLGDYGTPREMRLSEVESTVALRSRKPPHD